MLGAKQRGAHLNHIRPDCSLQAIPDWGPNACLCPPCVPVLMLLPVLQLNQPLPLDVRADEWRAELHRWVPSLMHAGIEQLTIKFSQASAPS